LNFGTAALHYQKQHEKLHLTIFRRGFGGSKLTRLCLVDATSANAEAPRLDDRLLKLVVQQPAT
jgi:hypothetical protein